MSGRYDELRPDQAEDIHKGIAGSELVIFENSSHTPFHEERELFMRTGERFLDRGGGKNLLGRNLSPTLTRLAPRTTPQSPGTREEIFIFFPSRVRYTSQ